MSETKQSPRDAIIALARQRYGEEGARVVAAILHTEGGLSGKVGDNGNSYGPFQFHRQGMLPAYAQTRGLSVDAAAQKARTDPVDAAQWALDGYLGQAIQAGQQKGLSGPNLATYAQQYGQRSQNPQAAGQNYRALFGGDPQGDTTMPDDTTPSNGQPPQGNKDESLKNYDKAIQDAIQAEQDADAELRAIAAQIAALPTKYLKNDPKTGPYVDQEALVPAQKALEMQAAAASKKMDRARQDQQRNLQERERIRNQRNVEADTVSKLIDNQIKAIREEIAAGKLSYDSGMAQVNAIQDQAARGLQGILSAQTQLREGSSKMASPATRDAIEASIRGYSAFGAPALPGGHFLTLTPFDPMGAIKDYLPPKPDWEAWKQGLTGAKSGLDQYLSQHVEPGMEAIRGLVAQRQGQNQPTNTPVPPPQRPYVMMPSDAPDVPVYGGQVEPSAPPPPSAVPSRGGQFPEGGDLWKQAVLPRTPGEDTAARVQTGGLPFGLGAMGNASAPASATPVPSTPVPTATPASSQGYNSPEDMLDDPSLSLEQKLQILEQMRYGQQ